MRSSKSLVEAVLFPLKGRFDGVGLGFELGEDAAELLDEGIDEVGEEGFFAGEAEVAAVFDGAAEDAAEDVVAAVVAGEDAVGDGEGKGADVVGDHAEGDGVFELTALSAGFGVGALDDRRYTFWR